MKLFLLDSIHPEALEFLDSKFEIIKDIKEAEIIYTQLSKVNCMTFPNLRYVVTPCTGTDHIILNDKVKIIHLDQKWKDIEGRDAMATAELTIGLMLALIRKIPSANGKSTSDRDLYTGIELRDKTLGIIGLGRIGSKVKGYAETFGMKVLTADIKDKSYITDMINLLMKSDIITIHIPLNDYNEYLINRYLIYKMVKHPYIINTSRADIISPMILYHNLMDGKIKGAAIDGIEGYDLHYRELLLDYMKHNDNLIITPHIGGNTFESRKATDLYIARVMMDLE